MPISKRPSENKHYKPSDTPWWKQWIEVTAFFLGFYAIFIYKGQWDAAAAANKINAENFKLGQRAWIGLEADPVRITVTKEGEPIQWFFSYKNFGSSPALNVRDHARSVVMDLRIGSVWNQVNEELHSLDMNEPYMSRSIIFNGDHIYDSASGKLLLSADDIENIRSHAKAVVVFSRVQYEDIFHQAHESFFCRIYDAPPSLGASGGTICPIPDLAN